MWPAVQISAHIVRLHRRQVSLASGSSFGAGAAPSDQARLGELRRRRSHALARAQSLSAVREDSPKTSAGSLLGDKVVSEWRFLEIAAAVEQLDAGSDGEAVGTGCNQRA
jgi:hypothetical protein